jgi:PIN domain nuclease of toxin-antitoxin system
MVEVILDSSAVIAALAREPGANGVRRQKSGLICAVNYAEVVEKLTEWGLDDVGIDLALRLVPLTIESFDPPRAFVAGRFEADPKLRRLSLGDRACLALALRTGLPVLTADRAWSELDLGVDVRLIR